MLVLFSTRSVIIEEPQTLCILYLLVLHDCLMHFPREIFFSLNYFSACHIKSVFPSSSQALDSPSCMPHTLSPGSISAMPAPPLPPPAAHSLLLVQIVFRLVSLPLFFLRLNLSSHSFPAFIISVSLVCFWHFASIFLNSCFCSASRVAQPDSSPCLFLTM